MTVNAWIYIGNETPPPKKQKQNINNNRKISPIPFSVFNLKLMWKIHIWETEIGFKINPGKNKCFSSKTLKSNKVFSRTLNCRSKSINLGFSLDCPMCQSFTVTMCAGLGAVQGQVSGGDRQTGPSDLEDAPAMRPQQEQRLRGVGGQEPAGHLGPV